MRKIVEFIIISVIIIFGLLLEQNRANAETTDNTITIPKGQYFSKPISFQSGDSLTVSYKMVVLEGPQIDVYFFDSANFSHYKDNQQFFFIVGLTDEYTKYASNELTITTHDDYYLIFDNSNVGATQPPNDNATAYVSYNITIKPNFHNGGHSTDAVTKDITIQKGQYFSKPISFQSGDSLTVSYKLAVLEGPQIDVYFFDSVNFTYYKDNLSFSSMAGLTDEYTRFASNELTVTTHDDYYLVFDNTDKGATQPPNDNATAYVSYQITTIPPLPDEESSRNTNTPGFELMILIVAIAISLIILQKKYI
jgi:hypothetical protein